MQLQTNTADEPVEPDHKSNLLYLLGLPPEATEDQIKHAIETKKQEEIYEILAPYKLTDTTKSIITDILRSDPEKGQALLASMERKKAPVTPPGPTHVTPAHRGASQEEKIAAGNKLISEIRAEGKFTDYTGARNEARRRSPGLFQ
jgi:hypothetical protein